MFGAGTPALQAIFLGAAPDPRRSFCFGGEARISLPGSDPAQGVDPKCKEDGARQAVDRLHPSVLHSRAHGAHAAAQDQPPCCRSRGRPRRQSGRRNRCRRPPRARVRRRPQRRRGSSPGLRVSGAALSRTPTPPRCASWRMPPRGLGQAHECPDPKEAKEPSSHQAEHELLPLQEPRDGRQAEGRNAPVGSVGGSLRRGSRGQSAQRPVRDRPADAQHSYRSDGRSNGKTNHQSVEEVPTVHHAPKRGMGHPVAANSKEGVNPVQSPPGKVWVIDPMAVCIGRC